MDWKAQAVDIYAKIGRVGLAFVISGLLLLLPLGQVWQTLWRNVFFITIIWLLLRLTRWTIRRIIWRLRNRLLVAYMFIAMVPLVLLGVFFAIAVGLFTSQIALYLVTSEMDRRLEALNGWAERLKSGPVPTDRVRIERIGELLDRDRFPGVEIVLRRGGITVAFPPDAGVHGPPPGWKDVHGLLYRDGQFYGWAHRLLPDGDLTVCAPFPPEYMADLLPELGVAELYHASGSEAGLAQPKAGQRRGRISVAGEDRNFTVEDRNQASIPPPPAVYRFDPELSWFGNIPLYVWDKPGSGEGPAENETSIVRVRTRLSRVINALYNRKSDFLRNLGPVLLATVGALFLVVELVALIIGLNLTRTITGAVHRLYEGTQRVQHGDLAHRIEVKGRDQLAELGHSFNSMTANIEQLLAVAKEKERLQSELEIAREVQAQLYPKTVPEMKQLRLTAVCKPARMVSGDYYDYEALKGSQLAFAIGDVAGKGISAALLMATLQSSVRTQLDVCIEAAQHQSTVVMSPSRLVSQLNLQLYKNTSPEKYSTFFLGLFDGSTSELRYTNAGHLPPLLFRGDAVNRLEIDGTVVGAFPFAEFGESRIELLPSDLLVCYTDGITEPENAYGEMFGEDRLIEVVRRHQHQSDDAIIQAVMDAVLQWTGSPELQDDMTILFARRES